MPTKGLNQWPPNVNAITYELREVYKGTTHEAPAIAITTKAMRSNVQVDAHKEYSLDDMEPLHLPNLEKVASATRKITKALTRENEILNDGEGPNVLHDLDGSNMDQW